MRHKLAAAFVIASTACATSIAYSADETRSVTFSLSHSTSPEAATVLCTIVGVKNLQAADDHTITVRDTREKLALAEAVVKMLDTDDTANTTPLSAGDGSVIAAVVLSHTSSKDVMVALQKELQIARSATAGEKRIFLRDTDRQIQAALKVIERLERNQEDAPETS